MKRFEVRKIGFGKRAVFDYQERDFLRQNGNIRPLKKDEAMEFIKKRATGAMISKIPAKRARMNTEMSENKEVIK